MKKHFQIWAVIFGCLLPGCGQEPDKKEEEKALPVPEMATTDMVFSYGADNIPAGFALDTLTYEDTLKRVSFILYRFKGMSDSLHLYNAAIEKAFIAEVHKELAYYDTAANEYETSEVEFGPVAVAVNSRYINVQFIKDSYSWGGNHHNYDWFSWNYDRGKGKILGFEQEFVLKTQKDSLEFRALVGRHLERTPQNLSGCCNDSIDFFLDGQDLVFGPYLSWAEGLQTSRLPLDSLEKFLHKKGSLRKEMDLGRIHK